MARQQPFRQTSGHGRVFDAAEHGPELVATEAGDGVAGAARTAQLVGHVHEQPVATAVPEGVVDHLELVEVDHEHGDAVRACGARRRRCR